MSIVSSELGVHGGRRPGIPPTPGRSVNRLYSPVCPSGTNGKRDLTNSADAQGAHGVMTSIKWTSVRACRVAVTCPQYEHRLPIMQLTGPSQDLSFLPNL